MDIFDSRTAKPMLIGESSEPFDSADYLYELKMDGERCLAYTDGKTTELINRRGRRILPQFPELAALHEHVAGRCILDGEVIIGAGGKKDFDTLMERAMSRLPRTIQRLSEAQPSTFVALDILYAGSSEITGLPLTERKRVLEEKALEGGRLAVVRTVEKQGVRFFRLTADQGMEGVIAKRKDSLYRMGRRTRDWVKFKNWLDDDFLVCGYILFDRAAVAGLVLGQYNDLSEVVYKGRVTLGLNRNDFGRIKKQRRAARHPFAAEPPEGSAGAVWLVPELICTVGFMCRTEGGLLRQPFYRQLVPDKSPQEVTEQAGDAAIICG